MGQLTVLEGGLFTTVQDAGRFGFRKYGVPISGAMDELSYKNANELVQNPRGNPVLECTLIGGSYRFNSPACIAITGGNMEPEINEISVNQDETIFVKKGDVLTLKSASRGCRTYIGISGKWNLKPILGSFSTNVQSKFGGIDGRTLQAGDVLQWQEASIKPSFNFLPKDQISYYSSKITIELEEGPEFDWIDKELKEKLFNSSFLLGSKSNRMAIRLESDIPVNAPIEQMKSAPVMPGIVQLPPNGKPIILMKDAQTVGGYPRIGIISDYYLSVLAQIPPNGIVRFKKRDA